MMSGIIELPKGGSLDDLSLATALRLRRSVREFTAGDLDWSEIGQLLWAAQGVTEQAAGLRTAPSAGALYPLELHAATRLGVYRYRPQSHTLVQLGQQDVRHGLAGAALGQEFVAAAPCVFAIFAVMARTTRKYGARGERYACIEAGHAAQNLLLAACALGLASTPVGAFDDYEVTEILGLDPRDKPLYLVPVGRSQQGSPRRSDNQ
jgi:SagB-type dehydrogenase family enzyme